MPQWEWKDKNRNVYQIAVYWNRDEVQPANPDQFFALFSDLAAVLYPVPDGRHGWAPQSGIPIDFRALGRQTTIGDDRQ